MTPRTTRLSASRVLRARKICAFIYDKLELGPSRARTGSVVSTHSRTTNLAQRRSVSIASTADQNRSNLIPNGSSQVQLASVDADMPPEDVIELICGNTVVDPKITLATLRHYYGGGGDMLLHYRLKQDFTIA